MNTETVTVTQKGENFEIIVQHDQSGSTYGTTLSISAYEQLRQPVVSGSDRIAYIEEELGRCNWCNRDAKYKTINQGNLCNHCYNKLHKFQ